MIVLNPHTLAIVLKNQPTSDLNSKSNNNEMANRLIKNFHIQSGFGLAGFLNLDNGIDNFSATRSWVNRQIAELQMYENEGDSLYQELEHRFCDCLPDVI